MLRIITLTGSPLACGRFSSGSLRRLVVKAERTGRTLWYEAVLCSSLLTRPRELSLGKLD